MKSGNKHISAVLLAIIMATPLIIFASLLLFQFAWKLKAEERLEKEQLVTITVSKHDFTWEKAGKEIQINGDLFDVKSFSKSGALYVFTGIFDHQETIIKNWLAATTEKQDSRLVQLLPLLLLNAIIPAFATLTRLIFSKSIFSEFYVSLQDRFFQVALPPPRTHTIISG